MARFQVNILGCGSATPSLRHYPACQVLDFRDNLFMIDCGEGAQLMMRRMKLKFSRLNHIFISHLHGDHFFGLPGLISTLALQGRDGGYITVHAFQEGLDLLKAQLDFFCRETPFNIMYSPVDPKGGIVYEDGSLTVKAFPLYHRVPCVGYIFKEQPKLRHLRGDMVKFYNIPMKQLPGIKAGADFVTDDGKVIPNCRLTTDADPAISYAYCSDTMMDERVADSVSGVDVVYHEATYTDELAHKARERGHSTASEAAKIAKLAGASKLILGHFSKRYFNEEQHLAEARAIFPNVVAANEGMKIDLL